MSVQRQGPTLGDIELKYHDSKTNTDALVATLLREYKAKFVAISQQLQSQNAELERLRKKNPEKATKGRKKNTS